MKGTGLSDTEQVSSPRLRGWLVVILAGIVTVFLGATAVLVGPANGISKPLRKPVADRLLPHLNQNWGLFAPNPINTNNSVLIRAQLKLDEKVSTTDWVNISSLENNGVLHNPLPGLDTRFADGLAKYMRPAILALPAASRPYVPKNQMAVSGATLDLDPNSEQAKRKYSTAQRNAMSNYLRLDEVARGLATVYAHKLWDGTVLAVQVRLRFTPVPSYANRDSKSTPTGTFYYVGWRAPAQLSEDALRAWE